MAKLEKTIGDKWVWFTDYVYFDATWTLNCEAGRACEVGTGVKAFGRPRGDTFKFSGHTKFKTYGIGAIHVRVVDRGGPCQVRLDQGDVGSITIYSRPL